MLIFLYGKDTYRRQRKYHEILLEYRKKHSSISVETCDAAVAELEQFVGLCRARTLFDNFKLVIVRDLFDAPKNLIPAWAEVLRAGLTDTQTVFIILADAAPPKAFACLMQPPATAQEFAPLQGMQFEEFIKRESSRLECRLTPQLLRDLALRFAGNSVALVTELEVLALLPNDNIKKTNAPPPDLVAFRAVTTIRPGRPSQTLPILEQLLSQEDPAYIFNLIAHQADARYKTQLADYDIAVKSGKLDYETALTDYLL